MLNIKKLAIGGIAAAALVLAGCGKQKTASKKPAKKATTVKMTSIQKKDCKDMNHYILDDREKLNKEGLSGGLIASTKYNPKKDTFTVNYNKGYIKHAEKVVNTEKKSKNKKMKNLLATNEAKLKTIDINPQLVTAEGQKVMQLSKDNKLKLKINCKPSAKNVPKNSVTIQNIPSLKKMDKLAKNTKQITVKQNKKGVKTANAQTPTKAK